MLWQIVIIVLLIRITCVMWRNRKLIKLSKHLKTDIKALPLIGQSYLLTGNGEDRMRTVQLLGRDAIKQGGLSSVWLGGIFFVIAADPVALEVIMKTCLEKHGVMKFLRRLIGNGSIMAPVSIWRPRRKVLAPTFSPKNLNKFTQIFSRESTVMVDHLRQAADKGTFSIWNYLTTYTMDSVCGTTLGIQVHAQTQLDHPFLKAFDQCCQLAATHMMQPWLQFDFLYKVLPSCRHFMKCKRVVCDFVDQVIQTKKESLKDKINTSVSNQDAEQDRLKTFLELIIEVSGGSRGYTNTELREETIVLVLAGTDTSAVGASFTAVMLASHQGVQEKVYQELQEVFGDLDRPIVAEDLPRLKYLEAVIKETLRLYPPVPAIMRKVDKDVPLPSGITLVKGCGVVINIWAVHRNPQYWGEDAEQFRPERFLDSPPRHPAAYLPFSLGARACIGYQYAMMSMKTALASLVRRYRVRPAGWTNESTGEGSHDVPLRLRFDVMMKHVDGFTVQLETRK